MSITTSPIRSKAPARRGALASLAGLVLAAVLVGCAPGTSPAESPSAPAPEATSTAPKDGTIDFDYEGYTAKIPANPQRVVVLDSRSGLEMALLADYPIVATAYGKDSPLSPLVDDSVAHLKNSAFDLNREEIASYNPDLIVVGTGWWGYYDSEGFELDQIAPVLAVNDGINVEGASPENPFISMTEQLTQLGRADKAAEAIADYEASLAEAKEKVGEYLKGKTASVIHAPVDNFTVISNESIYQVILPALGLSILENDEIATAPVHQSGSGRVLSYESAVSALGAADLLLVYKADTSADLDPLLKRVPAVAEGRWVNGNLAQRFGFALTYKSFVEDTSKAIQGFDDF